MCGIVGIVSTEKPIPPGLIDKMALKVQHRGPDLQACVRLEGCDLGHRRLSIIDLSTGDQPMSDPTGRWWIVYNGETYNYRELKRELENKGVEFRTKSDTEVILQGYIVFGEDVVLHLNGQFAFAIWDDQKHVLFAARDRFGEKPFYWAKSSTGDAFIFASEIKALLETNLLRPKLDFSSVDLYLDLYYVPPDRTIYSNIFTLQPGHVLKWERGEVTTRSYWKPAFSGDTKITPHDAIEKLRGLIRTAVERQMVADVPVGALLSGGLDSSTVVAFMSEFADRPVMTFSVGFGDLIDELPFARAVAQRYKTNHHEIQMDIPVAEALERMSEVYDEPFADSSNIPTYLLAEFASRYVKVCLSGDGGDELFGGYSWYQPLLSGSKLDSWEGGIGLRKILQYSLKMASKILRRKDLWEERMQIATLFPIDHSHFWSKDVKPPDPINTLRLNYKRNGLISDMDRVSAFDINCYLAGDILVKVDRAMLAHGLESRAPFLDVELAEFVLNLPWQLRFKEIDNLKYLLRASCQDLWPDSIQHRNKQGFGAPIDAWINRDDVKSLIRQVFLPTHPLRNLFSGLNKMQFDQAPTAQKWTLLCLGLWLEHHADSI
jgi:asparagine synthase (glutamine-hydrolysing)